MRSFSRLAKRCGAPSFAQQNLCGAAEPATKTAFWSIARRACSHCHSRTPAKAIFVNLYILTPPILWRQYNIFAVADVSTIEPEYFCETPTSLLNYGGAETFAEDVAKCLACGMNDHVVKQFSISMLLFNNLKVLDAVIT